MCKNLYLFLNKLILFLKVLKSTYSGNMADPKWESSSSSIVKPLQLT